MFDTNLTDIQDIRAEIEEYMECAGYEDYNKRVLIKMTDEEVFDHYKDLCRQINDNDHIIGKNR